MDKQLFRQKSLDHISSPEELHDYMRVTSPRLWMILTAIVVLLAGFIVCAATTRMESTEKISLTVGSGDIYGYIPANVQDRIKVGMPVRIAGKTGTVSTTSNQIRYVLNVSLDNSVPLQQGYYLMTIGTEEDICIDENGSYSVPIAYTEFTGDRFILPTYTDTGVLQKMNSGDVRACFWTEKYDEAEEKFVITDMRLATVSGYEIITTVEALVMLDDPEAVIPDGTYEAEIVTESETPISFLWN